MVPRVSFLNIHWEPSFVVGVIVVVADFSIGEQSLLKFEGVVN